MLNTNTQYTNVNSSWSAPSPVRDMAEQALSTGTSTAVQDPPSENPLVALSPEERREYLESYRQMRGGWQNFSGADKPQALDSRNWLDQGVSGLADTATAPAPEAPAPTEAAAAEQAPHNGNQGYRGRGRPIIPVVVVIAPSTPAPQPAPAPAPAPPSAEPTTGYYSLKGDPTQQA